MIPKEIERLFERLEPIFGRKIEPLRMEYQLNPTARAEIELLLSQLILKHLGKNCPFIVPDKGSVAGDYPLGKVLIGNQIWGSFGLNESEWIQHAAVFGRSGSGKTNVGFLILKEFCAHKKPFLVFDWKRNYRDLLGHAGFAGLKIFTVGRDVSPFHFNPLLPPPGTEPEIFLKKLIEIMMHVYWLGDGVAYLLQTAMDEVFKQRGSQSGLAGKPPTLFDVRDWVRNYKARGREAQWMDSTRRVVETLCFGQMGKTLAAGSNEELERALASRAVLELDALSNADKTFFIESILLWIHHKRMAEPDREKFKHAILIEEAHHVLLKRKESKETIMDIVMREIRELGEAIIFLDQHPSLISVPSLGNSYCTIAMNLKHGNDISALTRAMLLTDEEKDVLGTLAIGDAIVKLQGRWIKPFQVRFEHFQVEKGKISDGDLRRQNIGDYAVIEEISRFGGNRPDIPPTPGTDRDAKTEELGSDERRFLEDVMASPLMGINERKEKLGLSIRRQYSLISSLHIKGLISSSSVSTLKGKKRIIRLTAAGATALSASAKYTPIRHESAEHWYWKLWLAEKLQQKGYLVEVEKGGADIAASKAGKEIAFEIETGKSDAEANIRRDLEQGFCEVVVVCLNSMPTPRSNGATRVIQIAKLQEFLDSLPG